METRLSDVVRFDEAALGRLDAKARVAALYGVKGALMERIRLAEREAAAETDEEKAAQRAKYEAAAERDDVIVKPAAEEPREVGEVVEGAVRG